MPASHRRRRFLPFLLPVWLVTLALPAFLMPAPAAAGTCATGGVAADPPLEAVEVLARGACLVEAREFAVAREWFAAHPQAGRDPRWSAAIANEIGQVEAALGRPVEARARFEQARASADAAVSAAATLNLARLAPPEGAAALLRAALAASVPLDAARRAPLLLAIAEQGLRLGGDGRALAHDALEQARRLGEATQWPLIEAQALDLLGRLHEELGDTAAALQSSDAALLLAGRLGREDLLMSIEWRRGRLLRAVGQRGSALAAFQRAADHLARIRRDIPVEYADGRSSFRETFAPVYLGLAELLLDEPGEAPLRRAREAVERIKQSELEDYLGDRCIVTRGVDGEARRLAPGTAVLYPVMLAERLELLIEHGDQIERVSVGVGADELNTVAQRFARALRATASTDGDAATLHAWLLAPVEKLMGGALDTLVVVPDASLRLFPFSSLRRGDRYAIEDYAIAVVPGLSFGRIGEASAPAGRRTLLAGLSQPGEVVTRLPPDLLRSLSPEASADEQRSARLKRLLALPGVDDEIAALRRLAPATVLLNESFTVQAFENEVSRGYGVVHVASHGVFGPSAAETFLMAHNDIITIDRLRQMLAEAGAEGQIELLTLSACETAEGDDRAPLGLAGAALRAQAGSALGSLWPVSDDATRILMEHFYRELLAGHSKAQALRAAQLALRGDERFTHPFHWAPFILVGDWH